MNYKIEKINHFKNFFLKTRLKTLETRKAEEIAKYASFFPECIEKSDNIEEKINSDIIKDLNLKISALKKIINN